MTIVELRDVELSYRTRHRRVDVLLKAGLTVPEPSVVAIVGPSGSGKTSILNCIAGLVRPQVGTVRVLGQSHDERSDDELADFRATQVGFVFQSFHLLPQLDAVGNVAFPLLLAGVPRRAAEERALDALRDVGLAERSDHRPPQLSGGEQQRAAIARALIIDPPLLLADEPTGNLDEHAASEILDLLIARGRNRTLVIVTHDQSVADRADVVWRMANGRLTAVRGTPSAA